ncbi:hypothetical protein LPJ61_005395 [Coemansia biformis]|uniref:Ubiquitin-like-conjugating enzyme ATG10 n=1 Tax=Coemansia biformis TaxID=1286918 RepID=A0A9W8CWN5_9FUNG|nr:hypothetical protein LPJ61_005395 [Coemansia biformis]
MAGPLSEFPYLTPGEFAECAARFVDQYGAALAADRLMQATVVAARQQPYLRMHRQLLSGGSGGRRSTDRATECDAGDLECDVGDLEDIDPALGEQQPDNRPGVEVGQVDYHIAYSRTWRVPVVYLRVYGPDKGATGGSEVVMDVGRVADMLVADEAVRGSMEAVEFGGALGIQDHPELGVPYLYLHPCHTASLLRAVVAPAADGRESGVAIDTTNYLAALLSLIGPAVGLSLPAVQSG